MVTCFPSSPKKFGMTVAIFIFGGVLFGYGLHLSYVNVAPQQARLRKRNKFVRTYLRKKYGYDSKSLPIGFRPEPDDS